MYVCMYICIFARTRQVRALSHPQPPSVPPIYPTCIRYMSLRYMSLLKCHYQRKAELPLSKKTLVIENKRPARSELFTNNNGGEYLRKPIYSFVVNHKQVQVTLWSIWRYWKVFTQHCFNQLSFFNTRDVHSETKVERYGFDQEISPRDFSISHLLKCNCATLNESSVVLI